MAAYLISSASGAVAHLGVFVGNTATTYRMQPLCNYHSRDGRWDPTTRPMRICRLCREQVEAMQKLIADA